MNCDGLMLMRMLWMQAQSDDDEAGETVALNMAASGDKFMEEFFEQVIYYSGLYQQKNCLHLTY